MSGLQHGKGNKVSVVVSARRMEGSDVIGPRGI
jgi:hypothetical protein